MINLKALEFGQADCFLLREDSHVCLIDCGSRKYSGESLPEKLERLGVKKIDILIVTHFHQDHVGYLSEITDLFKIDCAVFPGSVEKIVKLGILKDTETREQLEILGQGERRLSERGTKVLFANELPDFEELSFGKSALKLIFPSRSCPPFFYTALKSGDFSEEKDILGLINGDSSVWLLKKGGKNLCLFCGDCFEENFRGRYEKYCRDNQAEKNLGVLKLSHHGRNDKGHVYFTEEFVSDVDPKTILITNTDENVAIYRNAWEGFPKESRIIVTGEEGSEPEICLQA